MQFIISAQENENASSSHCFERTGIRRRSYCVGPDIRGGAISGRKTLVTVCGVTGIETHNRPRALDDKADYTVRVV